MDMNYRGGNVGGRGWGGWSGVKGLKWDNCNSIINKYTKKDKNPLSKTQKIDSFNCILDTAEWNTSVLQGKQYTLFKSIAEKKMTKEIDSHWLLVI